MMRVGEFMHATLQSRTADDSVDEGWFVAALTERGRAADRELPERLGCPADPLFRSRDRSIGIRAMISYPVRNLATHPFDPAAKEPQVLLVCPHHADGALVMTDDFDIRFRTREELGAPATGELVVGPDATHAHLKAVRYETKFDGEMEQKILTRKAQVQCANHLRQLGGLWIAEAMEKPGRPPHSGPALLVYYRKKHYIQTGREDILTCPLDEFVIVPDTPEKSAAYDELDLGRSLRKYVSFAVRDFVAYPLRRDAPAGQAIMACVHHEGGANVLYDDGAVIFRTAEMLGLDPGESITAGPDSESAVLRQLIVEPTKKD